MERRDFLKISALSGAVTALESCGSPEQQLIRFIPDEDLVPGIATWKPGVCTLCSAGCGTLVRVMEGDAEVVRKGRTGLIKMGLAKKLEGNPDHPINRGKLCARGHAALQVLYHPDRLANPLKRRGPRGSADFQEVSWDDALADLTSHLTDLRSSGSAASLAFLTRPLRGQRRELIERFLKAFGAGPPAFYEPLDEVVLRQANLLSFGSAALPTLDLARTDYLISFGADLLGTWNSPVAQSIGYGEMRQGRPGRRGKFVQVESRMSQTGANADEWVPCRPGMEGVLALGLAHVILSDKLRPRGARSRPFALIAGWSEGLPEYAPDAVAKQTGVSAETIARLAREIAAANASAVVIASAPLAQTNGIFNALAVNALQALLEGGRTQPPVLTFTPKLPVATVEPSAGVQPRFVPLNTLTQAILDNQRNAPKVLFLYEANPVFGDPSGTRLAEALAKIPYIVSFGSFIDETGAFADLILPDHAPLESWIDDIPESGSTQAVVSLAPPAVHPLHNTRAMPDVLLGVAQRLGGPVAKALPWKSYEEMLRAAYVPLRQHSGSSTPQSEDDFWTKITAQGGWWSTAPPAKRAEATSSAPQHATLKFAEPEFDGSTQEFPFYFQPFASQSFRDGSLAHLPWLQEMPDVMTTAMWSSWIEINPKTAAQLRIAPGDLVEVSSQHGSVRAPAILSQGIAPDLIAMPIGQGHEKFGRFANGRGANPLSILAPLAERETGALAWAATRVKLARIGGPEEGKLITFAGGLSQFPIEQERR
jgi:menaquinone reductase, molybdopterin-binding-like subunit